MVRRAEKPADDRATERLSAAAVAALRKSKPTPQAPGRAGFVEASTQLSGPPAFTDESTDQTQLPPEPGKPGSHRR
jgi:hypothetical protein